MDQPLNPYASPVATAPASTAARRPRRRWQWIAAIVVFLGNCVAQAWVLFVALILAGGPDEPTPVFDVLAAVVAFPFPLAVYHLTGSIGYSVVAAPVNSLFWAAIAYWLFARMHRD